MPKSESDKEDRILVADIGGTHARFGVATLGAGSQKPVIDHFQVFECANYQGVEDLVQHYAGQLPVKMPSIAALAVAGPISENQGTITNLDWHLDGDTQAKSLGLDALYFINDFGALAMSAPSLGQDDLVTIRKVNTPSTGPISVLGPGTGFGAAMLVPNGEDYIPVSSESGHISFAPKGDLQGSIWTSLSNDMGHTSIELLLSGSGLVRLYKEICIQNDSPVNPYDPRTISQLGIANEDIHCREALTVFCSLLGSVAGDIALVQGAKGGVYLGGGILPKIIDFFQQSQFIELFLDKGPMQHYMESIPIYLITAPDAALIGAAVYGRTMLKAKY